MDIDEVISRAEEFVHNFVVFVNKSGIKLEDCDSLEKISL